MNSMVPIITGDATALEPRHTSAWQRASLTERLAEEPSYDAIMDAVCKRLRVRRSATFVIRDKHAPVHLKVREAQALALWLADNLTRGGLIAAAHAMLINPEESQSLLKMADGWWRIRGELSSQMTSMALRLRSDALLQAEMRDGGTMRDLEGIIAAARAGKPITTSEIGFIATLAEDWRSAKDELAAMKRKAEEGAPATHYANQPALGALYRAGQAWRTSSDRTREAAATKALNALEAWLIAETPRPVLRTSTTAKPEQHA